MAAFGVTLSLTEKTPQQIIAYLEKMQQLQVGSVFSSLQIPGDDPGTLQDTLAQVGPLFRRQGLEFVVDVSPRTFRNFTLEQLRSWGVTSLRIDNGMEPQEIAEISHDFRIVLNASTLNDPFLMLCSSMVFTVNWKPGTTTTHAGTPVWTSDSLKHGITG